MTKRIRGHALLPFVFADFFLHVSRLLCYWHCCLTMCVFVYFLGLLCVVHGFLFWGGWACLGALRFAFCYNVLCAHKGNLADDSRQSIDYSISFAATLYSHSK